jgi:adenylosuccinate synthase
VTRSTTGLRNVLALAPELGIDRLDVTYVTRAYATRHGAGPLAHELPQAPHHQTAEETNIANPQIGVGTTVITSGRNVPVVSEALAGMAAHTVSAATLSMSFGPTRSSVRQEDPQCARRRP